MKLKDLKMHKPVTYTMEELEINNPGSITNYKLLKDFNKYIRDDDPEDPTNFVLKSKMQLGIDYKLLPRKCWKIINDRF